MSSLDEQDKIKMIQDSFKQADQGRAEILEIFYKDVELDFPNSDSVLVVSHSLSS